MTLLCCRTPVQVHTLCFMNVLLENLLFVVVVYQSGRCSRLYSNDELVTARGICLRGLWKWEKEWEGEIRKACVKSLKQTEVRYLTHLTHRLPVAGNHSDGCFTTLASIHNVFVWLQRLSGSVSSVTSVLGQIYQHPNGTLCGPRLCLYFFFFWKIFPLTQCLHLYLCIFYIYLQYIYLVNLTGLAVFSWINVTDVLLVGLTSRTNLEDCVLLDSVSATVCLSDCVHVNGCITAIKVQTVQLFQVLQTFFATSQWC